MKSDFKNRKDFALKMLEKYHKSLPNKNLSDIGAGYLWMSEYARSYGMEYLPFDSYPKTNESVIWDLNFPCPTGMKNAGLATFLDVLEHLPNPLLSLKHISDHLEIGGILLLSVPNPSWSRSRVNLLLKGTLFAFQEKHLIEHHVFTPWKHIVEFYAKESGFEVLEY